MQPLVPAEVDLRGLHFMPLDVNRLRDSQLAISASGDEFRAAVLLWCASWNQIPAASLPSDDQTLAAYAGFGRDLKGWRKVKSGAMRGFIHCDDGRFYHPVVAEKAMEAWRERVEFRERQDNEQDRVKNYRVEHKALRDALREHGVTMPFDAKISDLRARLEEVQKHEPVTETVTPEMLHVEQPVTETVTPVTVTRHAPVMAKTGTGTGTGTGTEKQKQELGAERRAQPAFIRLPLNDGTEHPITDDQVQEFANLYPAVDVKQSLRDMRGWCMSNPAKRKTKNGVMRFVNAWLAKEQDHPKQNGAAHRSQQGSFEGASPAAMRRLA